jgi:ribosomal protein L17
MHGRLVIVFERAKLLQRKVEKFLSAVKREFKQEEKLPEWLVKRIVSQLGNQKKNDEVYLPKKVTEIIKKFPYELKSGFTRIEKLPKVRKGDGAILAEIKFCFKENENLKKK